ncbi:MAG: hypothetical protein ACK4LQ_08305 [Pararhodobacter sp.]
MESTAFQQRKARILAARAEAERRRTRPRSRRALALGTVVLGTATCFFLLKGATLAYFGEAGFAGLSPHQGEATNPFSLWLSGADPITRLIAEVLRPGTLRS